MFFASSSLCFLAYLNLYKTSLKERTFRIQIHNVSYIMAKCEIVFVKLSRQNFDTFCRRYYRVINLHITNNHKYASSV